MVQGGAMEIFIYYRNQIKVLNKMHTDDHSTSCQYHSHIQLECAMGNSSDNISFLLKCTVLHILCSFSFQASFSFPFHVTPTLLIGRSQWDRAEITPHANMR